MDLDERSFLVARLPGHVMPIPFLCRGNDSLLLAGELVEDVFN